MTDTLPAPLWLVTHSGGFHADDVLSTAVLQRLFPQARVMRSRDPAWITPAPDRIIYDEGRLFDPASRIFDHHQRGAPLRAGGQPYSSFGLIWRHYGHDYLAQLGVRPGDADAVHAAMDARFVLPVDLMDNGALDPGSAGVLADLTLPVLIESLKPPFDARNQQADAAAFERAVGIAAAILESAVAHAAADRRAAGIVARALAAAEGERVLELPSAVPFQEALMAPEGAYVLFAIYPRGDGWVLTGVRRTPDTFALRADLPAAWAGLSGAALEAATGVPGARFCHRGRFLAVADSREAVLRLAALAVANRAAVP
ncbi:MAG: MYG1 family protein [Rubellimicrobium sp.]|nr:MYG1 family protein [Rubellimicrobium sp.]